MFFSEKENKYLKMIVPSHIKNHIAITISVQIIANRFFFQPYIWKMKSFSNWASVARLQKWVHCLVEFKFKQRCAGITVQHSYCGQQKQFPMFLIIPHINFWLLHYCDDQCFQREQWTKHSSPVEISRMIVVSYKGAKENLSIGQREPENSQPVQPVRFLSITSS